MGRGARLPLTRGTAGHDLGRIRSRATHHRTRPQERISVITIIALVRIRCVLRAHHHAASGRSSTISVQVPALPCAAGHVPLSLTRSGRP